MATSIHHGPPGSFKSFTLVQRFAIEALREGRVIVTNIRGFNSIDRVKAQFPDYKYPDSAQIIFVTGESKLGRALLAGFFHWVPMGAMILIDEAQRVYPDRKDFRLESLDKPIIPEGYTPEKIEVVTDDGSIVRRPEDVFTAYDMQRHFNWDIFLSTPNIAKIQKPIREVTEYAYLHKSLSGKVPFLFKNTWYEFKHDPENNGHAKASQIGNPIKYKADTRIFECYQSTVTGKHLESKADQSIFKDRAVQVKLVIILCCVILGLYFVARFSTLHNKSKADLPKVEKVVKTDYPQALPVSLEGGQVSSNAVSHDGAVNVASDKDTDFFNILGFKVLALAYHDMKDSLNKMAFIVQSENGLKVIPYSQLVSFGFHVYVHDLCHLSLRYKERQMIDITCYHPVIDRCNVRVQSKNLFSQSGCLTYADTKPKKENKVNNALLTASANLLPSESKN